MSLVLDSINNLGLWLHEGLHIQSDDGLSTCPFHKNYKQLVTYESNEALANGFMVAQNVEIIYLVPAKQGIRSDATCSDVSLSYTQNVACICIFATFLE